MKRIRLSSLSERVNAAAVAVLMALLLIWLCLALRGDAAGLAIALGCGVLALIMLGFYLYYVFSCACTVSPGSRVLRISGIPAYQADVSGAQGVCTREVRVGPVISRSIVFMDGNRDDVHVVSTAFTARGGALAEPAAKALAQAMGLEFSPSLPAWAYDAGARRERDAAQNGKKRGGSAQAANTPSEDLCDGINYDALDDKK